MLNPNFPNWANGANSSLVLTGPYTITGLALYQLPTMLVATGFGAASVAEGGTDHSPTWPEGDYVPNPFIQGAGSIAGLAALGQNLTFTPPTISGDPAPSATYEWCWFGPQLTVVSTGLSYTVQSTDLNKQLVVKTTATNSEGSVSTLCVPTGLVLGSAPAITSGGTIAVQGGGDAYPGKTLTITAVPTASGMPTPSLAYNWIQIGGLTPNVPVQIGGSSYKVKTSDIGFDIALQTTATNSSGTSTGNSNTITVEGLAPEIVTVPRLSSYSPYVGQRITGLQGTFSGIPLPEVTAFGFAYNVLPTPTPIPGAINVFNYVVTEADIDHEIVFYVTAQNTGGSVTAYSDPTWSIPENLGIKTPAKLQVPGDGVPNVGDTLVGVPATFTPAVGVSVLNQWASLEPDGSTIPIAGATATTYTLVSADAGKNIVFISTGSTTTPTQSISSVSNSSGVVTELVRVVTNPVMQFAGPAPIINEVCQITPGVTLPANNLAVTPGPTILTSIKAYRVDPKDGRVLIWGKNNPVLADLYVSIPPEAFDQRIVIETNYSYDDGTRVSTAQGIFISPPVTGIAPTVVTSGSLGGIFQYNETMTYTPATFTGDQPIVVTWLWKNSDGDLLQNGGLTYTPVKAQIGMRIGVIATARNEVGTAQSSTAFVKIAGDEPTFYKNGILTGGATLSADPVLAYTPAQASSPTDKPVVTWDWFITYPGEAPVSLNRPNASVVQFSNDNGRWTDAVISVVATATNSTGSVTNTSNVIGPMLGSPRILTVGRLYTSAGAAPGEKYLNVDVPTFSGNVAPVLSTTWYALIRATDHGFANPTTRLRLRAIDSDQEATGAAQAQNQYGTTVVTFPPINVGPVSN